MNGSSSPALKSPVTNEAGDVDELTPVYKVQKAPSSLRNRLHHVRAGMSHSTREVGASALMSLASPEQVVTTPIQSAPTELDSSVSIAAVPEMHSSTEPSSVLAGPPPPPPPPPPPSFQTSSSFRTPSKPQRKLTKLHWRPALNRKSEEIFSNRFKISLNSFFTANLF